MPGAYHGPADTNRNTLHFPFKAQEVLDGLDGRHDQIRDELVDAKRAEAKATAELANIVENTGLSQDEVLGGANVRDAYNAFAQLGRIQGISANDTVYAGNDFGFDPGSTVIHGAGVGSHLAVGIDEYAKRQVEARARSAQQNAEARIGKGVRAAAQEAHARAKEAQYKVAHLERLEREMVRWIRLFDTVDRESEVRLSYVDATYFGLLGVVNNDEGSYY